MVLPSRGVPSSLSSCPTNVIFSPSVILLGNGFRDSVVSCTGFAEIRVIF